MILLTAIRTAIFYLLFLGQTVVLAIVVGTHVKLTGGGSAFGWRIALYWNNSNLWLLRVVAGIRSDVAGAENIPPGACIIASKHQSDWDIFAILPNSGKPAFVAKRELMDIPFFGWAARSLETIRIDRSKGSEAIPLMLQEAKAALASGCRIIIFPEGTRKAPLAPTDYRVGIQRMYEALDVPVVPVALNSGLYWGRNSLLLWPGTARARFLPPIPPGLSGPEFMARLETTIETATNGLLRDAWAAGLDRPVSPELRAKLEALGSSG